MKFPINFGRKPKQEFGDRAILEMDLAAIRPETFAEYTPKVQLLLALRQYYENPEDVSLFSKMGLIERFFLAEMLEGKLSSEFVNFSAGTDMHVLEDQMAKTMEIGALSETLKKRLDDREMTAQIMQESFGGGADECRASCG